MAERMSRPIDYSDPDEARMAVKLALRSAERMQAERDALAAIVEKLLGAVQDAREAWSFDQQQAHTHSWHDAQDWWERSRPAREAAEAAKHDPDEARMALMLACKTIRNLEDRVTDLETVISGLSVHSITQEVSDYNRVIKAFQRSGSGSDE